MPQGDGRASDDEVVEMLGPLPGDDPETGSAPVPAEPPAETPPEAEPTPAPELFEWAGRQFPTRDEAERSYRHAQSQITRQQQELEQAQGRIDQFEEAFRQVYPTLQRYEELMQQGYGQTPQQGPEQLPDPDEDPDGYINALVDQKVNQRLSAGGYVSQEQWQQSMAAQQEEQRMLEISARAEAQATQSIAAFRERHPEVEPDSQSDYEIAAIVAGNLDQSTGLPIIDVSDADQLDMAYEVWKNPALGGVLSANPSWVKSHEGRELIRRNAALLAPQSGVPGNLGNGTSRPQPRAHVEVGGTGAPIPSAPGERPRGDAFDEVLELNERLKKEQSVFFR
jgi:hypothetical protein